MSELDLILNALATGAAATASQAVQDAYQTLKTRLGALFDGRPEAQGKLNANPTEAHRWAELIGADLAEFGAATDTEAIAAARKVRELAGSQVNVQVAGDVKGGQFGNDNIQNNTFGS
jgi:hypothetical protein